jgi:hypothetical protein
VDLEVDDVDSGDAAEPVLQPLGALLKIRRLLGRAFEKLPELLDVHAGHGNG